MKHIIKALSIATFLSATVTVASIFYEGMVLRWFPYVGISILVTDMLFLIATVAGFFYFRSNKVLFYAHAFSMVVILAGTVVYLIFGKEMPKILFTLWEFYILYFYGTVVCKKLWQTDCANLAKSVVKSDCITTTPVRYPTGRKCFWKQDLEA